jgi:hypothetical protein
MPTRLLLRRCQPISIFGIVRRHQLMKKIGPLIGDSAMISGYIGSRDAFDDAICELAVEYTDQNRLDHKTLVKAVREGYVKAIVEGP